MVVGRTTDATVHVFDNLSRSGVRYNLESLRSGLPATQAVENHGCATCASRRGGARSARGGTRYITSRPRSRLLLRLAIRNWTSTSIFVARSTFWKGIRKSGHHPFLLFTSTNKVYGELNEHMLVSTAHASRVPR